MIKIVLLGNPLSSQHIYKSHCRFKFPVVYMSKKGKEMKESYQKQAKEQYKGMLHSDDLEIDVKLYFKDKRSVDVDNFNKLWADSLEGIVYQDDKQIKKMTVEKFISKDNPRIELNIKNYET